MKCIRTVLGLAGGWALAIGWWLTGMAEEDE